MFLRLFFDCSLAINNPLMVVSSKKKFAALFPYIAKEPLELTVVLHSV